MEGKQIDAELFTAPSEPELEHECGIYSTHQMDVSCDVGLQRLPARESSP